MKIRKPSMKEQYMFAKISLKNEIDVIQMGIKGIMEKLESLNVVPESKSDSRRMKKEAKEQKELLDIYTEKLAKAMKSLSALDKDIPA